jgi:hypothetical protein
MINFVAFCGEFPSAEGTFERFFTSMSSKMMPEACSLGKEAVASFHVASIHGLMGCAL